MMERRTLLGTSVAATVAASAGVAQAAKSKDEIVDRKIDPWNQPPEMLKSRYQRLPKQDDEARQHFTRGLAKWVQKDGQRPEAREATKAMLEANGASMTEPTKLDLQQSFDLMLKDPGYAARTRLIRTNFHIHWDNPKRAFYRDYDWYMAEMEKTDRQGPGKLELNPNMDVPEYTRYEIHTQPGGYVGDPFAGWIYDYGHYSGTDALMDFARPTSYAQNIKLPKDGQVRRILDIGCSMGHGTQAIKERFPNAEVWGIDIGGPLVRYAHYRAVKRNLDINYAQRLAEDTKFPDGYFDIVSDCIMFHEVTPQAAKKIVAETHRILRPGGVFNHADVATTGQPSYRPAQSVPEKASLHVNHRENIEPWWVMYITSDFPSVVKAAGFDVDLTGTPTNQSADRRGGFPPFVATKPA